MTRKRLGLLTAVCCVVVSMACDSPRTEPTSYSAPVPQSLAIDRDGIGIILVDVQPAFVDIMHGPKEPVMERLEQLLVVADWFQIPLVATFEHPTERKGWLPDRLEKVFPEEGSRFVKRTFNLCREPEIRSKLRELSLKQIVLAGCETDVCVLQSALGLLDMGYRVFLLEDCIFTNEAHTAPALTRMHQAGVIASTYKSFFYEMLQTVDRDALPDSWKQRTESFSDRYKSPYELIPWEPVRLGSQEP